LGFFCALYGKKFVAFLPQTGRNIGQQLCSGAKTGVFAPEAGFTGSMYRLGRI
jgi:hypothetical protein